MNIPYTNTSIRTTPAFVLSLYILAAIVSASTSIYLQGFRFGAENNIFHIPYVLSLATTQEFSDDAFYGSLRNFTSIFWPALRLVSSESNIETNFLIAHFLSRAGAFIGLVFLARSLGLYAPPTILVILSCAALTPWLRGSSIVGDHGIFIDYLTHSETTWGLIFAAFAFISRARFLPASAFIGLVFSINAFIGIWVALACIATVPFLHSRPTPVALLKCLTVFLLFSAPVLFWIFTSISDTGRSVSFSYINYIREYYPEHFLIESVSIEGAFTLTLIFFSGLIAAQLLPASRFLSLFQISILFIFLIGIPAPYIIDSRFIFNLHLLRSAGLIETLSVIFAILAGARLATDAASASRRLLGLVTVFSTISLDKNLESALLVLIALSFGYLAYFEPNTACKERWFILKYRIERIAPLLCIVVLVFLMAESSDYQIQGKIQLLLSLLAGLAVISSALSLGALRKSIPVLVGVLVATYAAGTVTKTYLWRENAPKSQVPKTAMQENSWQELTTWIRNSEIHGVFLLPVSERRFDRFQLMARRKVWVDWAQGAAVMWDPAFHSQWMPRYRDVLSLNSPADFLDYATENGIEHIVLPSESATCPPSTEAIKTTGHYVLCRVQPLAGKNMPLDEVHEPPF